MNLLFIWITLPSGEVVRLGEIAFGDMKEDGTAPTAFRYAQEWLEHPGAFPINPDPQTLPLEAREFQASNLGYPLRVFDDALPDDWGRRLIVSELQLPQQQQGPFWIMRAVRAAGLGALTFSTTRKQPPARAKTSRNLDELSAAAIAFDAGEPVEDAELHRLYVAGSTPGGARPKALVSHDEGEWIAKFPSRWRDQGLDVVGLEATCLVLARLAELEVPDCQLALLGARRAVLVRRFDITPAGGRCHMISLATLCREAGGSYVTTYEAPANAIRRLSDDPADVERFFRQMVFNAAIGNTDDHLKNFLLLRSVRGYYLSPAFDLVPDIGGNRDHQLAIGHSHSTPTGEILVSVGAHWLGNATRARTIVTEVIDAVARFSATADSLAVESGTTKKFAGDIERRLKLLRTGL